MGKHFGNSCFTEENVRVDNNENNAKMSIMLRSISAVSDVTLQIIVQFYFFYPINTSSYFDVFFFSEELTVVKKRFDDVVFMNSFLLQR